LHAFILFIIAISASVLGALTGIGGGIIVKPVVDAAGLLSSATANFLCGCMVLSMSIVSIARNRKGPKPPMKFVAPLAFGAAAGGISGNLLFGLVKKAVGNNHLVVLVQACVLLVLLAGALLYSIFKTKIKNLSICPSNINLAGAEVELVSVMSREYRLKEKLDIVKGDYDYIIIDCPPSLGLITLNAFTASDSILIPVQCEYYALEGLGQLMNTINLVKKHLNKDIEIEGALLTMYDVRTNLSNQVVKEVKRYFEDRVYKTVIPRNVKLSEAPSYGMPITVYDPKSKGAKCYEKLAKEFIKKNEEEVKAKHMKE